MTVDEFGLPKRRVEVAFGHVWTEDPATMVWVDLYEKLADDPVTIQRGRTTEREQDQPATMSCAFNDPERDLDPDNQDSPYWDSGDGVSLVRPDVPVRVVDETATGDDVRFYGFVDDWKAIYSPANVHATVALTATDLTKMLGRAPVPESVLALELSRHAAVEAWYRLAETSGSQMVDSSPNNRHGVYEPGTTRLTAANPGDYESAPGMAFDGAHFGSAPVVGATVQLVTFRVGQAPTNDTPVVVDSGQVAIWLLADGTVIGDDGVSSVGPATVVTDNEPHVVIWDSDANKLWLDGVPSTASVAGHAAIAFRVYVGGYVNLLDGLLANAVLFNSTFTDADAALFSEAFLAPWDGDRVDERIVKVAEFANVPSVLLDLDICQQVLGPAQLGPRVRVMDLVREAVNAEQGRQFTRRTGALALQQRYHLWTESEATTVQLEIVDNRAAEAGDVWAYSALEPDSGGNLLITTATGEGNDGTPLTVTDDDAVARHGVIDEDLGRVPTATAAQLSGVLRMRVERYKRPRTRLPVVSLKLHRRPANAAVVAAIDLGQRVKVTRTPMGVGDPVVFEGIVESITDSASRGFWQIDFALSPAESWELGLWDEGLWDEAEWGI